MVNILGRMCLHKRIKPLTQGFVKVRFRANSHSLGIFGNPLLHGDKGLRPPNRQCQAIRVVWLYGVIRQRLSLTH